MNHLVINRSWCGETRHPSRHGIRGFTLTEILVTIALTAQLLGLLLPALRLAWEKAIEMQWRSNLKTVALAWLQYAQDNDGASPKVTKLDETAQQVCKALEPYIKDKKIFQCRRDPNGPRSSVPSVDWRYTVDPKYSLGSGKLHQIRNPGRVPIGGDRCPGWFGKGTITAIFADGHVERMKDQDFFKAMMSPLYEEDTREHGVKTNG